MDNSLKLQEVTIVLSLDHYVFSRERELLLRMSNPAPFANIIHWKF